MLKNYMVYKITDKYAIYKNHLHFFVLALVINLINLIIATSYTQNNSHGSNAYREILIGYFLIYLVLSGVLIVFYLVKGLYIAVKQRKEFAIYFYHLVVIVIITIPMLFMLVESFMVYTGFLPSN